MSNLAETVCDESLDERYNIIECDICGEEGLDGKVHSWSDQRRFREETKESVNLVHAEDTTDNGYCNVCESCCANYVYVADCEALCPQDYAVYVESEDEYYTEDYAADNFYCDDYGNWTTERPGACLDYSERVTNHFSAHRPFAKRLVMGVELEVEPSHRTCGADLVECIGGPIGDNFICTEDSSLDDGLEVNCMPFTLDEHKSDKYMPWQRVLKSLRENGGKSGSGTTACGMHVHVNRRALSQLQIGKMLVFANSRKNADELTEIFQRADNSYAMSSQKTILDGKACHGDRCERINLNPEETIEVRAFKGNIRYERVMKNIEFVHAMVIYCRDCSMRDVENWSAFKRFVAARKGIYNHLHAYILERGI